jgi:DNA polymerase-3 subunit delta
MIVTHATERPGLGRARAAAARVDATRPADGAILRAVTAEKPPLKLAYLICGSDRPRVRRTVARLRQRVTEESGSDLNVAVFDARETEAAAVIATAETPSFVLGRRLILVTDAQAWKSPQRKLLAAYLDDPMPETILALEATKYSKDDALAKAVARVGEIFAWDVPKKAELDTWVQKRARAQGLRLTAAGRRRLVALVGWPERSDEGAGEHMEVFEREIEKLAAYCGGEEAGEDEVEAVCTATIEARVFALTDAVGRHDRARAFALLEQVFAGGEDAGRVFYTLLRHVRLLGALNDLGGGEDRLDRGQAAKALGVHPYAAQKLLEQRRTFGPREVNRALTALAAAETGMRGKAPATLESEGGADHGARLVLELALARMLEEG